MPVQEYAQLYHDAGSKYGVDPILLMAQAEAESSGNPNAVGPDTKYGNARGIAQLIPATAKSLGVTDPNDPTQAIPAQAKLMAENLKRYKNVEDALRAYHGGTDKANWGEKTNAYPEQVFKHYKNTSGEPIQMAQNTDIDDGLDPFEGAKKDLAAMAQPAATTPTAEDDDLDPFEGAKKDLQTAKVAAAPNKEPISVTEDVLKTVPSSVVKGIGAIPQIPAIVGNAVANSVGYGYGKMAGASPEQQEKLNHLNPFFTGNTPLDTLAQSGRAILNDDPGQANPLTGEVLHSPETMPGRAVDMLTQAAVAGPAAGAKLIPSLSGAAGAETASELFPDNPLAPLVGATVGGVAPSSIKSMRLRATPEEMAAHALEQRDGGGDPFAPEGQFSFAHENPIIPGVKNTLAEVTQDPNLALIQRKLQSQNPSAFKSLDDVNETLREQHFEKASGTPQDVEAMQTAREAQRKVDTDAIFKPGQAADPIPVIQKIDEILSGPGGERSAVKNTLTKIRSMLSKDKDGAIELQTNPEKLYRSVKHEIEDMMDKKDLNNAEGRQASGELKQVKEVLDKVIEKATPGYAKYLDNYSSASAKIDAAKWLQSLKLTDVGGRYTLAKVRNALDNAKKLQSSRGLNEAKHITPDQMEILQNLHDDLLRRENPARASMPRGSPTVQNLLTEADVNSALGQANHLMGGKGPEMIGSGAGLALGAMVGHPTAGAFLGDLGVRAFKNASARKTVAANANLEEFMLNPESYKEYLINRSGDTYVDRLQRNLLQNP